MHTAAGLQAAGGALPECCPLMPFLMPYLMEEMMMSDAAVRVRYAPSPTGNPHIGNIRTAMFNWLFARGRGGRFVVRVEDTDRNRITEGAVEHILDGLEWLGIDWDEGPRVGGAYGPYFQSERLERYQAAAERLLASGDAYRCYCPPERVAELRKEQARNKQRVGYDSRCRDLTDGERRAQEAAGQPSVVRFAMPQSGVTAVDDVIRGYVEWQNELTDDFVLVKSDGFPTYHLAVVVDDHAMEISHVLRAEEWLPSAPRHIRLYRALELPMPQFGASADDPGFRPGEAVQAARGDFADGVPGRRVSAGGAGQLYGAAGVVARRGDGFDGRGHHPGAFHAGTGGQAGRDF